jgi:hypothetical protein
MDTEKLGKLISTIGTWRGFGKTDTFIVECIIKACKGLITGEYEYSKGGGLPKAGNGPCGPATTFARVLCDWDFKEVEEEDDDDELRVVGNCYWPWERWDELERVHNSLVKRVRRLEGK